MRKISFAHRRIKYFTFSFPAKSLVLSQKVSYDQGWAGSQLWLRLPEAELFAKMLAYWPDRLRLPGIEKLFASASASASLQAVFDEFGLGFGFVIFFYGRLRIRFRLSRILCLASAFQQAF